MIVMLFLMLSIVFSGAFYFTNRRYTRLDSAFQTLDYSLPNLWITDIAEKPEHPFYDTKKVEATSIAHFSNNLKGFLPKYEIIFYYFDAKTLEEEIGKDYVTGVRLSIRAQIGLFSNYNKASIYVINV